MVLTAHRIEIEVRRLLASERDVACGPPAGVLAQQPADFQQDGHGRGVVVGSGCGCDRVIVGTEQNDFVSPFASRLLDDQVGGFVAECVVAFAIIGIAHLGPLAFDVSDCRFDRLRLCERARTDQPGKSIDMQAKVRFDGIAVGIHGPKFFVSVRRCESAETVEENDEQEEHIAEQHGDRIVGRCDRSRRIQSLAK